MTKSSNSLYDLIVIGGGAAGMMAAGVAAKSGNRVLLLEKNNTVGRKIRITGKGRCNVTNDCDRDVFFDHIMRNSSFLYSAYASFSPQDAINFFEELGVPLKVERGRRVFPLSDNAHDIADALFNFCKNSGVKIIRKTASKLLIENDRVKGVTCSDGKLYQGLNILLATGGLSYPATGSTGDGLKFAKEAGHKIVPCKPSLVPMELNNSLGEQLQGLSLKNVMLIVRQEGKKRPIFKEMGEMLFTHFGISGPLVLSASSVMSEENLNSYKITLDLKPALTLEQVDKRILRDISQHPSWECKRLIYGLLPKRLGEVLAQMSGIDLCEKAGQLSREARTSLKLLLKELPLPVKRFRPISEAIITSGGVDVSGVCPKTMESKICKGLYFAGEILDVDGQTGGYNLQIAWSTGYLAGKAIKSAEEMTKG